MSNAALATSTTALTVARFLEALQIAPRQASSGDGLRAVPVLVVSEQNQSCLVISPAGRLLDLDCLNSVTGQSWRAHSREAVQALCEQHGLQQLVPLPELLGIPAIVDQHLLESAQILLDTPDGPLGLPAQDFARLVADARVADISLPMPGPTPTEADDVADITEAVKNFTTLRIRQRLEETLELPPLPHTAQEVIKLRADPNADLKDLAAIVDLDPALASQVVSWAASPYYCAPGKVKSVFDAIQRVLGYDLVLNLALGLSLGKLLRLPKDQPEGLTPYWTQAVFGAAAMQALVQQIPARQRPVAGLAYLSGLLHNFGYLVLAEVFPPQFSQICRLQEVNPTASPIPVERLILGVTRDQLAGWLMNLWNMPEEVCTALRHQRDADYSGPHAVYANALFAVTQGLRRRGVGDAPAEPVPAALLARLGLDQESLDAAIDKVMDGAEALSGAAHSLGR